MNLPRCILFLATLTTVTCQSTDSHPTPPDYVRFTIADSESNRTLKTECINLDKDYESKRIVIPDDRVTGKMEMLWDSQYSKISLALRMNDKIIAEFDKSKLFFKKDAITQSIIISDQITYSFGVQLTSDCR